MQLRAMGELKWLNENFSLKLCFFKTCVLKFLGKLSNESEVPLGSLLSL